jgi:ribosome maturation factor RimP
MPRDSRDQIASEIEAAVASARPDVEVVDVQVIAPQQLVRILVDHPEGVDHALCEDVTHLVAPVRERYAVEVSSPGLERPLTKPAHYVRAVGESIRLRLREPREGRRNFTGRVAASDGETVRLATDGGEIELSVAGIEKCNIIWNPVGTT